MAARTAEQNDESKELENRKRHSARTTAATPTTTSATQPSRGPVDALGKRHRPPQPKEPMDKRMGERRGKQMGQKSFKNSPRGQH
jgi:hypothetical protein